MKLRQDDFSDDCHRSDDSRLAVLLLSSPAPIPLLSVIFSSFPRVSSFVETRDFAASTRQLSGGSARYWRGAAILRLSCEFTCPRGNVEGARR